MTRPRLVLAAGCVALLLGLVGCGAGPTVSNRPDVVAPVPSPPREAPSHSYAGHAVDAATTSPETPAPPETVPPGGAVRIARGVRLLPGPDGRLPVKVRWVRKLAAPEAIAVDENVIYAADEVAWAFNVADGSTKWEWSNPTLDGLAADGGVVIGLDGPDHVRMWAPYNYDLTVERGSGRLVSLRFALDGNLPHGMTPFPEPPARYHLSDDPERAVACDRAGDVAFAIVVHEPMYYTLGPLAVPGGMALMTSSGHMIVLDYR